MNFPIFEILTLNLLLLHLQIPLYIPALIIVIAFYMAFHSFLLFACKILQHSFARIAILTSRLSHITPIIKSLHWLPVTYPITFNLHCITHRALSFGKPHYLNS